MAKKGRVYSFITEKQFVNTVDESSDLYEDIGKYLDEIDDVITNYAKEVEKFSSSSNQNGEFIESLKIYNLFLKELLIGLLPDFKDSVISLESGFRDIMNKKLEEYMKKGI